MNMITNMEEHYRTVADGRSERQTQEGPNRDQEGLKVYTKFSKLNEGTCTIQYYFLTELR